MIESRFHSQASFKQRCNPRRSTLSGSCSYHLGPMTIKMHSMVKQGSRKPQIALNFVSFLFYSCDMCSNFSPNMCFPRTDAFWALKQLQTQFIVLQGAEEETREVISVLQLLASKLDLPNRPESRQKAMHPMARNRKCMPSKHETT